MSWGGVAPASSVAHGVGDIALDPRGRRTGSGIAPPFGAALPRAHSCAPAPAGSRATGPRSTGPPRPAQIETRSRGRARPGAPHQRADLTEAPASPARPRAATRTAA